MSKLVFVDSKNHYGNMNTAARFFEEGMPFSERQKIFLDRRMAFGRDHGFDGHKVFMADQVDGSRYLKGEGGRIGSSFVLSQDYVDANPNGWSDIPEDILIITDQVPGVVAGHPVADCPVVMITDLKKGYTAVGHCSAEMIDARLPMMIADSLVEACGSRDEDLLAYVGACAGSLWTYDTYPKWAKDSSVWRDAIVAKEKDGKTFFSIDMRKAIRKQFVERNLDKFGFHPMDTITDPEYYSNFAASPSGFSDSSKIGRQFVGAFYQEPVKRKVK